MEDKPFCISFDPGHTTGYAVWDKGEKVPVETGQLKSLSEDDEATELDYFLNRFNEERPDIVVIEEYMVDPKIPHHHSKVETTRVIGQIKYWARARNIKVIMQMPNIKPIAKKWSGWKKPKGSHGNTHWYDAALHGYYYLHKVGIIPARVLEEGNDARSS